MQQPLLSCIRDCIGAQYDFSKAVAESRLDLPRLLADPAALASPPALLQTLTLLRAAPPRSGAWLTSVKNVCMAALDGPKGLGSKDSGARGFAGKKSVGQKGENGPQDAIAVGSYLGVLLALVARARRDGSRTKLLQREAEVR